MFKEPTVSFQGNGARRRAVVTLHMNNDPGSHAIVNFIDPENPDEKNSDERLRVLGLAKDLFAQAAVAC